MKDEGVFLSVNIINVVRRMRACSESERVLGEGGGGGWVGNPN